MKKIFTLALMCLLAFTGFSQDPGTFDSSFGTDGMARFAPSTSHDFLEKILVQEDGKILTAGRSRYDNSNYDIYVSRQNADGSLDATFGTNGISHYQATQAIYINAARDIAFGNDGLIFIAGYTYDFTNNEGFVLCIDENGYEYPYFGNNGFAISEYGGGIVYEALDVDSYGRPIVTGYLNDTIVVRRYNAVGQLDPSFGDNGTVQIGFDDALFSFGYAINVLEDNKILVAGTKVELGTNIQNAFIMRLKANGTLDNTFGNNGCLNLNVGDLAEYALDIAIDADGNYLVAGHNEMPNNSETLPKYEAYVTRVLSNGTVDTSFGTNGFTRFEMFEGEVAVNNSEAVVGAQDGQVFGTLYSFDHDTQESRAYVYNLNENGQLNEDFAGTGILPITLQSGDIEVRTAAAAMQEDGKLLIGGMFFNNDGYASDVFVTRINTSVEGGDPIDPEIFPADVLVEAEAIDAYSVKATFTPNEHTTEYHAGILAVEFFDAMGEELVVEALKADGNPLTGIKEITYNDLTPLTAYYVVVVAKNEADEWVVVKGEVTTPEGIGYEEIEVTQFNVYPNPATSTVFVETNGNAQVSIIDMTGRVVKEMVITDNVSAINIEDINEGIYFIMIQNENNRIVEKLVVK